MYTGAIDVVKKTLAKDGITGLVFLINIIVTQLVPHSFDVECTEGWCPHY